MAVNEGVTHILTDSTKPLSEEETRKTGKNAVSLPEKYHLRIKHTEHGTGHSCPAKPAERP